MVPLATANSFRDRTADFAAAVARLRQAQDGAKAPLKSLKNGGLDPSQEVRSDTTTQGGAASAAPKQQFSTEFSRRAAEIGRHVQDASAKVAQLRGLTKRSTVFNDPAEEIERLTRVVKADIQSLNGAISALQDAAGQGGAGSKQSSSHTSTVVESLRARLRDATKEFKDVLTARTESLRVQQSRREMYSATPLQAPLFGPRPTATFGGGGAPQQAPGPANSAAAPTTTGLGSQTPVLRRRAGATSAHDLFGGTQATHGGPGAPLFQQQQQQLLAPQHQSVRAEELRNVESTIVELGGIFQQMASMVQEQGESMLRIDENIEETLSNVEGAQAYLLKYMNAVSSNRGLILKILAALMFVMILFAVFVL